MDLESRESSSPITTRAIAAGLQDRYCDTYEFLPWQRLGLEVVGALPQAAGRFIIPRLGADQALTPEHVQGLTVDQLAAARLRDYADLPGRFPVITAGAALSGPVAHLSLALGGPFLPQAFVLTLRGGSLTGDARTYFLRSAALARRMARDNPGALVIQHYDPVHDGWLTRWLNHVRLKLVDLPPGYRAFIHERLEPGGALVYFDCGARWLRYRVGARHVFQVGGWGGVSPDEFLAGSDRIRAAGRREGLTEFDWRLPDYPLERGPESEWGSESGLAEALETFAAQEGYRFIRIRLQDPHDFSQLAFRAIGRQLEAAGRAPSGVLVEMFTQFDATAARRAGLLPLWLVFNTSDALAFLRAMRPEFPAGKPVFFSPLATFSRTPDLASWAEWEATLAGLDWRNVGARASHYPADARALVHWAAPLRHWADAHPVPTPPRLSVDDVARLAEKSARRRSAERSTPREWAD